MAQAQHTPTLVSLEEAITVLFCLIDDACPAFNPKGWRSHESLKKLSESEVLTLALRASFPATARCRERALVPARCSEVLLAPVPRDHRATSLLAPSPREEAQELLGGRAPPEVLPELVGDPETLIVDSTLLEVVHPRQVNQSAGSGERLRVGRGGRSGAPSASTE